MKNQLFMDGTKLNRHVERVSHFLKGEKVVPIHFELSLTNKCQQNCSFCYIDWSHGAQLMSLPTITSLFESAGSIGVKSCLIAGEGEPTLNKHYIEAIKTANENGVDVALNTNAISFPAEEQAKTLPLLSWVRFSFQSANKELYGKIHDVNPSQFDIACKNIRSACNYRDEHNLGVKLGLQQVLIPENAETVFETCKLARELGCDYYVIKPCHPHELNVKGYTSATDLSLIHKELLEQCLTLKTDNFTPVVRWNFLQEVDQPRTYTKCLALPFIIQIKSNGDVVTCYPHGDKASHVYGNLNQSTLAEIVTSDSYWKIIENVRDNLDVSKCMPTCRQHNANNYLWWLTEEEPLHLNFI